MTTKQIEFKVGSGILNSPTGGTNVWQADLLRYCIITQMVVNKGDAETQTNPCPDYIHNYVDGTIIRFKPDGTDNNWVAGDTVVLAMNKPE